MNQSATQPFPVLPPEKVEAPVQGEPAQTDMQSHVPDAASQEVSLNAPAKVLSWVTICPIPFHVRNNDLTLQEFAIY